MDGTVIRFAESDVPLIVDGDTFPAVPGIQVSAVKHIQMIAAINREVS